MYQHTLLLNSIQYCSGNAFTSRITMASTLLRLAYRETHCVVQQVILITTLKSLVYSVTRKSQLAKYKLYRRLWECRHHCVVRALLTDP